MRGIILLAAVMASRVSAQPACPAPSREEINAKGVFETAITHAKPLGAPKGEFETTAAFDARMARAVSTIAPMRLISFPWVASMDAFKFDADAGVVSYGSDVFGSFCETNLHDPSYAIRPMCIEQQYRKITEKPKAMTNGFGATVVVTPVHDSYVGIILGNEHPRSGAFSSSAGKVFSFPATTLEAQSLKKNAVLVIRLSPKPPLYLEGGHYYGATVDDPIEIYGENYFLVGDIECASLADAVSGKVFQTIPIGPIS